MWRQGEGLRELIGTRGQGDVETRRRIDGMEGIEGIEGFEAFEGFEEFEEFGT